MANNTKKVSIDSKYSKIKRLVFISMVLLASNFNYGQDKPTSEIYYSPNGLFDKVFDKEGNAFNLSEIEVAKPYLLRNGTTTSNTLLCTSGIFELYFETGSGMEIIGNSLHDQRRAIICQAFQDISDFINTPLKNTGNTNKIKFWIRSPTALGLPANAAGSASSFYSFPTLAGIIASQTDPYTINNGGILDNEIWKTIHTGTDSYANTVFPVINTNGAGGFYHGYACFNFGGTVNWNLDYTKYNAATAYPLNYTDFYSTIIHEVSHALGFNSLSNYNGYSNFFFLGGNYFTRYDKNLKTSSNLSLILNPPSTGGQMYGFAFNQAVPSSVLAPGCSLSPPVFNGNSGAFNCPTSIKYVGGVTVPVYNPPCFENGSSLSHFEDACYNGNTNDQYFMMSERASGLFAKRTLTSEERQVLCDIGYSVNGTFGNTTNFTYKDYGTTACSGITVAGVNDCFSIGGGVYAYQGNSGSDITISGILNNDYTAGQLSNLRFEFAQDLYDLNAIITPLSGTAFTLKSYVPGIHLLRYVPYDIISGQRGNITYIYVKVFNNCQIDSSCNLVRNGDMEEHVYAPNGASQIYKSCGWDNASYIPTAEYFNSDATYASLGVPSNANGNQPDKIIGNHAYVGMYVVPYRANVLENVYSESIKTELSASLQPNTAYQLTFDVSMSDYNLLNAIKFQAFITDTNLELLTGGIIPIANITSDKVFLTNSSFSGTSSATTWETITFTFTTGNNPNLKYLYLGGLNNVQFQDITTSSNAYYYVDNVSLTRFFPNGFLDAVNDDFTNMPINSSTGGVSSSVYGNDLYNGSTTSDTSNVTFSLVSPLSIPGATINNIGQITIPPNTPAGIYNLTYKVQSTLACNTFDTATVVFSVSQLSVTDYENNNIKLFPNPANSIINITNANENIKVIELYDMLGRILQSEIINKTNAQLDISNYKTGTYFIKIKTDYGISNKTFIKN